jgi:hypothetical protein
MLAALVLSIALTQVTGQAKIIRTSTPTKEPVCRITQVEKNECRLACTNCVPVCNEGAMKGTYRCDKEKK